MRASDIKVGNKYWWNDPDEGAASNYVTVVSVTGEGEDAVVACKLDTGGEVQVPPGELEEKAESAAKGYDIYYSILGISREEFQSLVCREMLNGISSDYAKRIADRISDDVAQDIFDTADHENWNDHDARLGIGRVLLKAVGGDC